MAQKAVLKEQVIELRGIKVDLNNLHRISSPVLRRIIKKMYKEPRNPRPFTGWREYKYKEYNDHSEYSEYSERYMDSLKYHDYRDYYEN